MATIKSSLTSAVGILLLLLVNGPVCRVAAQGTTAFTYQGQLHDSGTNANGSYTMVFKLYDAGLGGNQIGGVVSNAQSLVNGLFTATLDFGPGAFDGTPRWLDITVQSGTVSQTLAPRPQILATPYAQIAATAGMVANGSWSINFLTNQYGPLMLFVNDKSVVVALTTEGLVVEQGNLDVPNGINFGSAGGSLNSDNSGGLITSGNFGVDQELNVGGGVNISKGLTVQGCINGQFCQASDRNLKCNFEEIDCRAVLERVASLPISTWKYKRDANTRHVGPMAQDFYSAFRLGADELHIETVDEGGVALAAIQGLNEKLKEKETEFQELKTRNEVLEKRLAALERLVQAAGQK